MNGESRTKNLLIWLVMLVGAILMAVPFWVMLVTSLVKPDEVFQMPPRLWPDAFHWDNYQRLFAQAPMGVYFLNSVVIALITTVGHVVFSALAGYAF